jgi:hypothetical protein
MERHYIAEAESPGSAVDDLVSSPAVESLMVLGTAETPAHNTALEEHLQTLSIPVFGGVFPQIIVDGTARERGTLLLGLHETPEITRIDDLSDPDATYDSQLPDLLTDSYQTAFVFVDAFATRTADLVSSLFDVYGPELAVLGGGAGALSMEQQPCLFTNDGLVEDAGLVVATQAPGTIGVSHGWQEFAGPFRVTDATGAVVRRLGEDDAFAVYRDVVEPDADVSLTADNFFEVAKSYPLAISRFEAEKIVRDPFEPTADGGLRCFGDIPEGAFVHVLKGEPDSLVDAARTAATAARETPTSDSAALETFFFDCISRVLYLEEQFERELDAVAEGDTTPLVGALTIGEIANSSHGHLELYNKTAVVGALEDV